MKRFFAFLLAVLLFAGLCACGGMPVEHSRYRDVTCLQQDFHTCCLTKYTTQWDDTDGLYIYLDEAGAIPYVLLWRYEDMPVDAGQYLEEAVYTRMTEKYGDDLVVGPQQDYTYGDYTLTGMLFTYPVQGETVHSLRLLMDLDNGDIMNFTAKYLDGQEKETMKALETAIENFEPTSGADINDPVPYEYELDVTPSELDEVTFTDYADPSGCFTCEIPQGWEVSVGLKPTGDVDLISYAICVSDPENPDRMVYLNLNCSGVLKSQEAHDWYVKYYGESNIFAQCPVAPSVSTEGFFRAMNGWYDYTDFTTLENLGTAASGGDVLAATALSTLTGNTVEGLFTAWVTDNPYSVQKDMFNYAAGTVDVGPLTMYTVVMETAEQSEFPGWQPVLDYVLSSIQFTETFRTQRQAQWQQVMGTAAYLSAQADEISDMIMDTWSNSSRSFDINSQKQSDATLGLERIYDSETGKYYHAELGFSDTFTSNRYQLATDDDAYLAPISGTIQ